MTSTSFRPDIEGLRALAVLAVLGFHLGLGPGGFTGVDVFFVISGYLITGIITRELSADDFSLWRFYARRAKRILPALTVLLVTVAVAGGLLLFDNEQVALRKSQLATALFGSNIYFWRTSGYFAQPSSEQPLLHTWSLGVEEQFYVLFPLLLIAVFAARRTLLRPALWTATLVSFAASVVLVRVAPTAAFYLLPTRAWELGAGALLAIGAEATVSRPRRAQLLSLSGAALLAWSFTQVHEGTPFPGEHALPAVLGATAVIAAGPGSPVGRLLSLPPVRWVGRLSYSLYLWHWPLIVLFRITHPGPLGRLDRLGLAAGSFVLAALSWRLVEQPVRRVRLPRRRHVLAFAGASLLITGSAAYAGEPVSALRPTSAAADAILRSLEDGPDYRLGTCFISSGYEAADFAAGTCLDGSSPRPDFLLLGDSHAADLWEGLHDALPGVDLLQATASGCKPLVPLQGEPRCTGVLRRALDGPLSGHRLDTVIVAARWRRFDLARLPATLRLLEAHSRRVVVLGPTTEYTTALPTLLARGLLTDDAGLAARNLLSAPFDVEPALRQVVTQAGAVYVSQLDVLCTQRRCRETTASGVPLKYDYGHYTGAGGREVATALRDAILGRRAG